MIIVIGEALIDLIQDQSESSNYEAVVGGANANVAIALARRGTPQQFLARISTDSFGQQIRTKLEANAVGLDYAVSASESTSLAIASIGESGGASYSFYVNGTADWNWGAEELPSDIELDNLHAKAIQFGCLTMAMEPGNLVIEKWAHSHYNQNSLTISHDLNIRPALGFERGSERTRVERVNNFSHLIKASDDDINWLYGLAEGSSVDEIVWNWIGDTSRLVFVTRGGDGVSVYRKDAVRIDVPARKTLIKDTVGAGDTFCANLLGQLFDLDALGADPFDRLANLSDESLYEISKVAAIAASLACEKRGAEPPTLLELNQALATNA